MKDKEYHRKYYLDNKIRLLDYQKRRYEDIKVNKAIIDKQKLQKRIYYKTNKEKVQLRNRTYYQNKICRLKNSIPIRNIVEDSVSVNVNFD
tara:strand:+ start:1594 stop:1866 length:273 start_codon:yes stop_codon:yes gene_type:complete